MWFTEHFDLAPIFSPPFESFPTAFQQYVCDIDHPTHANSGKNLNHYRLPPSVFRTAQIQLPTPTDSHPSRSGQGQIF